MPEILSSFVSYPSHLDGFQILGPNRDRTSITFSSALGATANLFFTPLATAGFGIHFSSLQNPYTWKRDEIGDVICQPIRITVTGGLPICYVELSGDWREPMEGKRRTGWQGNATIGVTAVQILGPRKDRKRLTITCNSAGGRLTLAFGIDAVADRQFSIQNPLNPYVFKREDIGDLIDQPVSLIANGGGVIAGWIECYDV